jgi:hypothetical protein
LLVTVVVTVHEISDVPTVLGIIAHRTHNQGAPATANGFEVGCDKI